MGFLNNSNNDLGILTTDNNNANPLIKVYSKSITTTVTGGSGNVITVDFSSCSGIAGYTALSLIVVQNNDSGVLSLTRIYLNGHTATIGICAPSNWSSSTSLSVTFSIRVAFIRLQYMNIIW